MVGVGESDASTAAAKNVNDAGEVVEADPTTTELTEFHVDHLTNKRYLDLVMSADNHTLNNYVRDVRRIGHENAKNAKSGGSLKAGSRPTSSRLAREEAMATLAHDQVLPEVYISSHNLHVDTFGDMSLQAPEDGLVELL